MNGSVLHRKLIRELWASKGQALAIAAVVAAGVAVFVMSLSILYFLRDTRDAYYERYRFGHVFASLRRAPQPLQARMAEIPGVGTVQTRVVADVTLDVPNLAEPATGRLISIPADGPPSLNAYYLQSGRLPDPLRSDEVLASEAFFVANKMRLGTTVRAVINGRHQQLRIVGVALSPEYVFQIRPGSLLPDDRRFGVFWMNRKHLEAAFDMEGGFNDVSLRLLRGANTDEVIAQLDRLLKPYGSSGAYSRQDQISASFLDDEIQQLRGMAVVAPIIFLGVAAFLLNVVLSRRIRAQREIIATMKAFGFSNRQVARHYLATALLITLAGAAVGSLAGVRLAAGLARLYSEFYRFPEFVFRPDLQTIALALLISLIAALAGAGRAVWQAVRLMPAEAMRPPAPARYRRSWVEVLGLAWLLPLPVRMILRHLQRHPLNSLFSVLGIAAAVAVLLMGNFSPDAVNYLLDFQFRVAQRHDVQVVFEPIASPSVRFDLLHLPGVQRVEVFRSVPIKARHLHHQRRVAIMGLGHQRDLYRLLDANEHPIRIPPGGIVLSDALAEMLQLRAGQWVEIEVLEGKQGTYQLPVAGIAKEYAGLNAYMDIDALHRLLGEDAAVTGAYLSVLAADRQSLYQRLKQTPRVGSVAVKEAMIEQFENTISENLLKMQTFNYFFAAVIAIGVIYNTARVSLDERARELSTLRVIGFSKWETAAMLLGELSLLTLCAIPVGWGIGYAFCYLMVQGFESEQFRIPLVIRPASYAQSATVAILAAAVSGWIVRRKLNSIDLVEVLKTRE